MAGIVRPKSYPIRKITDNTQRVGRVFNPPRFPDHGGFTSASKWDGGGEFKVESPTSIRTGEEASKSRG